MNIPHTPSNEDIRQALLAISAELSEMKQQQFKTNLVLETYQKTSTQVINLAFGLIATATLSIIVSLVLKR